MTQDEALFQSLIWNPLVSAALIAIKTAIPFLNIFPLNILVDWIGQMLAGKLFSGIALQLNLAEISFHNSEQLKAYSNASIELKTIAQQKGVNSPDYAVALENAKSALASFVKFN